MGRTGYQGTVSWLTRDHLLSRMLLLFPGIFFFDRTHVALDTLFVHDSIDLVGGDARLDGSSGNVENFSGQSTDLAHAFNALLVQDLDFVAVYEAAVLGDAIGGIVWVGDRGGDLAFR